MTNETLAQRAKSALERSDFSKDSLGYPKIFGNEAEAQQVIREQDALIRQLQKGLEWASHIAARLDYPAHFQRIDAALEAAQAAGYSGE